MPGPNSSPDSINTNDRRPKAVGNNDLSKSPAWLNSNAKKIYKNTAEVIKKLGISDKCDTNFLAMYSAQLDRLQVMSEKPNKDLREERMLNDLTTSVIQLSRELGITPSARAKLRLTKVEEDNSSIDELLNDES
jgi:P27 family predicted phage terminase small subunit